MGNQIFDRFHRSEFSDEIFAIFGRALTVATRFDASTKALARLPFIKVAIVEKPALNDEEFNKLVQTINKKYKNLNRAIFSLKLNEDIKGLLTQARESRNELIHEVTLGTTENYENVYSIDLSLFLDHVKDLVHDVIKGDALISTIISIQNKEPISDYQFTDKYESQYVDWVMKRFES